MLKRQIWIVTAILVLLLGFFIAGKMKERKQPQPPKKEKVLPAAFVQKVQNADVPVIVPIDGSIMARNKINISAEVQGVLEFGRKDFRPGIAYNKGEVIANINSVEFTANLMAQKSNFYNLLINIMPDLRLDFPDIYTQWEDYLSNFDMKKTIAELPEVSNKKAKLFIASRNIISNYYSLKNLEVKLAKYTLRAPFNGVLTQANTTQGTLVSPGQNLGSFMSNMQYELEAAVNSSYLNKLYIGAPTTIFTLQNDTLMGEIVRINGAVDRNSQTVNVYVGVQSNKLRDGMYVKADIETSDIKNVFEIAGNLMIDQDHIFLVKNNKLVKTKVNVVHQTKNTVLLSGLNNGEFMLLKPVPKAFDGMTIKVANNNKDSEKN
ncbi:efflux RND transporter periplasmic adaptor subunit [Bacteroidales bacterium]|nr:efflux RND transporter periplasmic adaptor subunit [Bacteroidales bacterium]